MLLVRCLAGRTEFDSQRLFFAENSCLLLLEVKRAAKLNQTDKVTGCKNENKELKNSKMLHRAEQNSLVVILSGFIPATKPSFPSHIII